MLNEAIEYYFVVFENLPKVAIRKGQCVYFLRRYTVCSLPFKQKKNIRTWRTSDNKSIWLNEFPGWLEQCSYSHLIPLTYLTFLVMKCLSVLHAILPHSMGVMSDRCEVFLVMGGHIGIALASLNTSALTIRRHIIQIAVFWINITTIILLKRKTATRNARHTCSSYSNHP